MIAFLKGNVYEIIENQVILQCEQLGYEVYVSAQVQQQVSIGEEVFLYTYLHVRDDAMELYGFLSTQEKQLFQLLRTVSGIGPKSALAILGATTDGDLISAIVHENERFLTTLPGVGKKTASRLILELKDRVQSIDINVGDMLTGAPDNNPTVSRTHTDVLQALDGLGYGAQELKQVEREVFTRSLQTTEQGLLKEALAYLMKG